MTILFLLLIHWYTSLFCQTFFHHRYSAHKHFTMSKTWEKVFYVFSWITQGFTSISPNVYGKLHRMHHAYADTEKDVHSPKYDKSLIAMMLRTDKIFKGIRHGTFQLEERFCKNLPHWEFMEKYAYNWPTRVLWAIIYITIYYFAVPQNSLWMWALLPLHFLMTPLQGAIINWFAHRVGYRTHAVSDTSTNLMPLDIFTMGEGYHNNHHAHSGNANFSNKWYEFDFSYRIITLFNWLGIIQLNKK
ncbi:acyl-CoA desaturase [Bacteroidia bacterium]|nr:acyl-CoA desaturase [Bacteroidia bacterium]